MKGLVFALVAVTIALFVPNLRIASDPFTYEAYSPTPAKPLTDVTAIPIRLSSVLGKSRVVGLESIAIDKEGLVYGGSADGFIVVLNPTTDEVVRRVNIGGRPLGMHFHPSKTSQLIIAEAVKGLMSWDKDTGVLELLTLQAGNRTINYANDLDVAGNMVYFSDSTFYRPIFDYGTNRWSTMKAAMADIFSGSTTGRLLSYNFDTKETRVLLENLAYANGVAVSKDADFVLVAETAKYRVWRYWLSGTNAGTADIFIDSLPGFPDGITSVRTDDGGFHFWVSIIQLRNKLLDFVHPYPTLKKIVSHLPDSLKPKSKPFGMILKISLEGEVLVRYLDVVGSKATAITSVTERDNKLYIGGLEGDHIPVMTLLDDDIIE